MERANSYIAATPNLGFITHPHGPSIPVAVLSWFSCLLLSCLPKQGRPDVRGLSRSVCACFVRPCLSCLLYHAGTQARRQSTSPLLRLFSCSPRDPGPLLSTLRSTGLHLPLFTDSVLCREVRRLGELMPAPCYLREQVFCQPSKGPRLYFVLKFLGWGKDFCICPRIAL